MKRVSLPVPVGQNLQPSKVAEFIEGLQLDPSDYTDFMRVLEVAALQAEGMSIRAACAQVGIPRSNFYEVRWVSLHNKAVALISGQELMNLRSTANAVYADWPDIIARQRNIAKTGFDKDATAAAAFLRDTFDMGNVQTPTGSAEADYLKAANNFNPAGPLTAIQVQAGGELHIHNEISKDDTLNDTSVL